MSGNYDAWLHSLSLDGTYPCLLQKSGDVQIFRVKRSYSDVPIYTVWVGNQLIYSGTNNDEGFKTFRKCEIEEI